MQIDIINVANNIVSPKFIWIWSLLISFFACYWIASILSKSRKISVQLGLAAILIESMKLCARDGNLEKVKKSIAVLGTLPIVGNLFGNLFRGSEICKLDQTAALSNPSKTQKVTSSLPCTSKATNTSEPTDTVEPANSNQIDSSATFVGNFSAPKSMTNASGIYVGADDLKMSSNSKSPITADIESLDVKTSKNINVDTDTNTKKTEANKNTEPPKDFIAVTTLPSDLINDETVIDANLDQNLFGSIGGQLSAIGILGTFIGLSASIYLARGALASSSMIEMRSALDQLLGGAALAFWTSVIGIGSSLGFARLESSIVSRLKFQIQTLLNAVNQITVVHTIEQTSLEQLNALKDQNVYLKELTATIVNSNKGQSQIQESTLKDIVSDFRNTLAKGAPAEMQAIASSCNEILDSVKEGMFGLRDSNSSLLDASLKMGRSMEASLVQAADKFHSKLLETSNLIETAGRNASSEMGIGILEAGIFAAEQLKKPAEDMSQVVSDLSDKTRRATNDWSDAMISMERFASIFEDSHKELVQMQENFQEQLLHQALVNAESENGTKTHTGRKNLKKKALTLNSRSKDLKTKINKDTDLLSSVQESSKSEMISSFDSIKDNNLKSDIKRRKTI